MSKDSPLRILQKVWVHLSIQRKKDVGKVFILSIFSSLAESISIAMLVPFIGFFSNSETYTFNVFFKTIFDFFNVTNTNDKLTLVTFLFIFFVLVGMLVRTMHLKKSNLLVDFITSDFRIKIFNFMISQDLNYFYKNGTNEIMSNVSQKTRAFTTIVFSTLNILNSILISSAIVAILIYNEPFVTPIIIFSVSLFFFIVYQKKNKSVLKEGEEVNSNQNYMIDIFENTVGYLPEIILYNLKKFYSSLLSSYSKTTAVAIAKIRTTAAVPRYYMEAFIITAAALIIYIAHSKGQLLGANFSYIAILAFATQKCLPLINQIYSLSVNFTSMVPTVLSFLNIIEKEKKEIFLDKNSAILDFEKNIKIENVSFQYEKNLPNILQNINFLINKGDKIVIKGKTGTGKSTLNNIISGLLIPTEGNILVDGIKINQANIHNWQKNISIVPQIIFLTNTSILSNIAIAVDENEIDIEKVKKCAKLAHINDFIDSLPNKYNELVGERGIRLSGGQRQRVGIARALYRSTKLMIMDEPTNSLDTETEKLVLSSISSLTKNLTVVVISHSDDNLNFFDKIINLDKYK